MGAGLEGAACGRADTVKGALSDSAAFGRRVAQGSLYSVGLWAGLHPGPHGRSSQSNINPPAAPDGCFAEGLSAPRPRSSTVSAPCVPYACPIVRFATSKRRRRASREAEARQGAL